MFHLRVQDRQSPNIVLLLNDEEKQQSPTPIRLPILPTNVLVVQPNKIVFYVSCYNLNYKAASAPSSFCQIDIQQVRCYCRYSEYTTEVNIVNTPQKSCTDIYLRHLCNAEARRPMVFVGFVRTNCEEFKCVIAACFCWLCNVCSGCGQEFRCFVLFAVFQLLTESPCFHAPIWMQFLSLSRNLRSSINPAHSR